MRISRLFVVVAILAAILAPAPSEAQSPWRTRALINEHARYYQGNYRPLFVLPPMYGGRYGSPYETPYYGNSGGRFGLDGRSGVFPDGHCSESSGADRRGYHYFATISCMNAAGRCCKWLIVVRITSGTRRSGCRHARAHSRSAH